MLQGKMERLFFIIYLFIYVFIVSLHLGKDQANEKAKHYLMTNAFSTVPQNQPLLVVQQLGPQPPQPQIRQPQPRAPHAHHLFLNVQQVPFHGQPQPGPFQYQPFHGQPQADPIRYQPFHGQPQAGPIQYQPFHGQPQADPIQYQPFHGQPQPGPIQYQQANPPPAPAPQVNPARQANPPPAPAPQVNPVRQANPAPAPQDQPVVPHLALAFPGLPQPPYTKRQLMERTLDVLKELCKVCKIRHGSRTKELLVDYMLVCLELDMEYVFPLFPLFFFSLPLSFFFSFLFFSSYSFLFSVFLLFYSLVHWRLWRESFEIPNLLQVLRIINCIDKTSMAWICLIVSTGSTGLRSFFNVLDLLTEVDMDIELPTGARSSFFTYYKCCSTTPGLFTRNL
jgi:hypothetical protein